MIDQIDANGAVPLAMNATFSLVPTPSALDTSTGSFQPAVIEPEQAAERSDLGQARPA